MKTANNSLKKQMKSISLTTSDSLREVTHLSVGKCANLDWEQALQGIESAFESERITGPVDAVTLLAVSSVIQQHGTISLAAASASVLGRTCVELTRQTLLSLILKFLPVGALGCEDVDHNCVLVDLKNLPGDETVAARIAAWKAKPTTKSNKNKTARGRKSIQDKVKGLVEAVVEIVNLHAPAASSKRRHEIVQTGISLGSILSLLKKQFPGLAMDKRTLARLMCPPRRSNAASKAYKELVAARITAMRNDLRIEKDDGHYSCSQVSLLKELIAWIGDEATLVSCDEKAQFVVGEAGLVSRYHRNQNVTPDCVVVQKFDHDFKYSQYLIACSGMMELENGEPQATYIDEAGRQRLKTPCTGTSHLMLRSVKFGKPDLHSNIEVDMRNLMQTKKESGTLRPVWAAIVDGGSDYLNTREATILLLGRLFRYT
jgi:hypothetical protein